MRTEERKEERRGMVTIRTDLPTSVTTNTNLKSTDKEEVHHQDIQKSYYLLILVYRETLYLNCNSYRYLVHL